MKTLDIEKLSNVAGAEPHGASPTGRQNDGYDIVKSRAYDAPDGPFVHVRYRDGTADEYNSDGSFSRHP